MSAGDPPIHGCAHCQQLPAPIYLQTATSPSRLERVAEALFVEAIAARRMSVGSEPSVKQVAETAIKQALVFEKAWEARES